MDFGVWSWGPEVGVRKPCARVGLDLITVASGGGDYLGLGPLKGVTLCGIEKLICYTRVVNQKVTLSEQDKANNRDNSPNIPSHKQIKTSANEPTTLSTPRCSGIAFAVLAWSFRGFS